MCEILRNLKTQQENDDLFCIYYQDRYWDLHKEDWIMCSKCEGWAHNYCTAGNTSRELLATFVDEAGPCP